ncbi:MAG: riboflavin synthase [Xanthomonadales bacterium]|nr:riboflavin synthase [Gammaproteobacteria bacterium]MBT8052605.1 riboflavin synthase [Gammaproteobacteria bacterium]NND56636.1 riboflavin synthase [Xanthomonadales bacterium]NNK52422.1 riboflavin synthase [Xanthomonadales bacterium]
MFTGIVETTGKLEQKVSMGGDCRLHISCSDLNLETLRAGDSISVSGACLTMLEPDASGFFADVSTETLALTTLGQLREGQRLNLELALGVKARLGGHMVTGHVDGKARLISRNEDARAERFEFEVPASLARYVAKKGSVCLDGVSLTVNEVDGRTFTVCLIPHTLEITTLGNLAPGDEVNLEVDLIARYLERLLDPDLEERQQPEE